MTNTAQIQNSFIKPLSQTKGYEVYMHGAPQVGEVFYRIVTDKNQKPQVEQLQLVDLQHVQETRRSGAVKVLYWKSNLTGNELASAVRSKHIVSFKEKNPTKQAEKIGLIKSQSKKPNKKGAWTNATVLHPHRHSQQVIQENVPMKVEEVRGKSGILYWKDKQGKSYWGNKGETTVRPFPEKRNTENCSDYQNA